MIIFSLLWLFPKLVPYHGCSLSWFLIIALPKHGCFQALKACIAIIGPSDPLQVARAIEERKVTVAGLVSKPWAWVLG